jgi:hypothetical protein
LSFGFYEVQGFGLVMSLGPKKWQPQRAVERSKMAAWVIFMLLLI